MKHESRKQKIFCMLQSKQLECICFAVILTGLYFVPFIRCQTQNILTSTTASFSLFTLTAKLPESSSDLAFMVLTGFSVVFYWLSVALCLASCFFSLQKYFIACLSLDVLLILITYVFFAVLSAAANQTLYPLAGFYLLLAVYAAKMLLLLLRPLYPQKKS